MFKTLKLNFFQNTVRTNKRSMWQWIEDTFNRFDEDRVKEVGPNIACAEWLMKNGAQVRWKDFNEFVSHYDCLPNVSRGSLEQFQIQEVYAGKEASISHIGFHYFKNCENISEITFVGCQTINDQALINLKILKNSLTSLKINGCLNVSYEGILALEHLQALKHLELKNLQLPNNPEKIHNLKTKLPECNMRIL